MVWGPLPPAAVSRYVEGVGQTEAWEKFCFQAKPHASCALRAHVKQDLSFGCIAKYWHGEVYHSDR